MYQQILVPLDGSAVAESILPTVTTFAGIVGAELLLLGVVEPTEPIEAVSELAGAVGERDQQAAEHAEAYLVGVTRRLKAAAVPVHHRVLIGAPAEAILQAGATTDLIAMATHGRSGIGRWVYGSVADKVLQAASVPVLLVRASAEGPVVARPPRRIVVPLDGSTLAEQVLPIASELASRTGGRLYLVQSVAWAIQTVGEYPYGYGAAIDVASLLAAAEQQAQTYLNEVARQLQQQELPAEVAVRTVAATEAIIDIVTEHDADLIVMSSHGRGGLQRWVLGSVADRVLHVAPVPVLILRSGQPTPPAIGQASAARTS
jgi:nucleotide-binding universal stress UspA family protein